MNTSNTLPIAFSFLSLTLVACGGGGGGGSTGGPGGSGASSTGVFLDSRVENLGYRSGGLTGMTDAAGVFEYETGTETEFFVGSISLGTLTPAPIVSPADFVPGAPIENQRILNRARFLQTIDDDKDPSNGIRIPDSITDAAFGRSVDFEGPSFEFDVESLLAAASVPGPIVGFGDARAHLRASLLDRFDGDYAGSFGGTMPGTMEFCVGADGVASGRETRDNGSVVTLTGVVTDAGGVDLSSDDGVVYAGRIDSAGAVSGTRTTEAGGGEGDAFDASRSASSYRGSYRALFSGGTNGWWIVEVRADGNARGRELANGQNSLLTGSVAPDGRFALVSESGREFAGTISFDDRIEGSWQDNESMGTFDAAPCAGRGDFDRDGFGDVAVGAPGTLSSAGAVHELVGGFNGLGSAGYYVQSDVGAANESGDQWGYAITTGDYDADGYADIVVSAPFEDLGSITDAGSTNVIYGTRDGLSTERTRAFNQGQSDVLGNAENSDRFGWALATGDFNGDGFDDLAVGVPYEDLSANNAGAVNVIYGSIAGLTGDGNQMISQDDVLGSPEADDRFGASVAAGDFNGDGFDDLLVGVPGEDLAAQDQGAVQVIYGSAFGLSFVGDQFLEQSPSNLLGVGEAFDNFGHVVAAGDFDGDGYDDMAVGVPFEDLIENNVGAVNIAFGSPEGITFDGQQFLNQLVEEILGDAEAGDLFGYSLATGDFDHDGYVDLAIGVPFEDFDGANSGAVNAFFGSAAGLSLDDEDFITQNLNYGVAEADDRFGWSLTAVDVDGDRYDDLVVGALGEDLPGANNAGAVSVLFGVPSGLSNDDRQFLNEGVIGPSLGGGHQFGFSLSR